MSAIALGAILPHGDLAIAQACDEASANLAVATQRAMDTAGARIAAAGATTVVVATPHGIHVRDHMAVVTAGSAAGSLEGAASVALTVEVDTQLASAVVAAMRAADVPAVEVSFGGNSPAEAEMPLDWGALVPLWHVRRHAPAVRAVIVSPARELDAAVHWRAGAAIADAAAAAGTPIAFIASADQGHGHDADGPYGFHAESAVFDARVTELVRAGDLTAVAAIDVAEVRAALADSWWQMVMLGGALARSGRRWDSEVLAYEAPTYYGMLSAILTPGR